MKNLYIKGFDKDLRCRGFQFEVGKVYDTGASDESLELCTNTVFHFCRNIQEVHKFYPCCKDIGNRYCYVEALGKVISDDEKCGSSKIQIVREINEEELNIMLGLNNNTGYFNTGSYNTGFFNTGSYNTGFFNTGSYNTGNRNTGYRNTGNHNTGYYNTGYYNTGYFNTGDRNTGYFNKCTASTGFFNTKERTITIFNMDSGLTLEEAQQTLWYEALFSKPLILTEWVFYTEDEKKNSPIRQAIGGYLKSYTFKEACANWWKNMSGEDKALIQHIPNFNKEIFKEITGIDLDGEE